MGIDARSEMLQSVDFKCQAFTAHGIDDVEHPNQQEEAGIAYAEL